MKRFAAIDIGSYELTMKIFEISKKDGFKVIDCLNHKLDLGSGTYSTGKLSHELIKELCKYLVDFKKNMDLYKVDSYKAYGTSAIREAGNRTVVLEEIKIKSGIEVEILSNSEQRFLDLKALASQKDEFDTLISENTLVLDIGGGSIQLSLFSGKALVATSNLRLGVLRISDALYRAKAKRVQRQKLINEMIDYELDDFLTLFAQNIAIENVIVFDDYLSKFSVKIKSHTKYFTNEEIFGMNDVLSKSIPSELAGMYALSDDDVMFAQISSVITSILIKKANIHKAWIPCFTLSEGIAYDYVVSKKLNNYLHDFESDILTCASSIAQRYRCNLKRNDYLETTSLVLFDSLKKAHCFSKRERLLLRLAARLNDCGRFVSLLYGGEAAYSIIMSTEIIGLSHRERKIVANIVKYNHLDFLYDSELENEYQADKEGYLTIVKLVAILKVANGLDRSRKQKCGTIRAKIVGDILEISVKADSDFLLEQGLFDKRAQLFGESYSLKPVIKVI